MNRPFSLRTVLVYHDGSARADGLVRLAGDLVASGVSIVVLAITRIPPSLPLYDLPATVDHRARDALRRASEVARRSGYGIETQLRRGRDLAKIIIQEAREKEADAILLTLAPPRFSWLPPRLSGPMRAVLRQAPCPVLLAYLPSAGTMDASSVIAEAERVLGHAS